jgi:hypothetical protein
MLEAHKEVLDRFHRMARDYFQLRDTREPYARRPPLSMRLLAQGEPAARLVVMPEYDRGTRRMCPGILRLEMLVGSSCQDAGGILYARRDWKIRLRLLVGWCGCTGQVIRDGPEALRRLIGLVQEFVATPTKTFARSSDHCCLCGKPLTDELSRARGIGPECLKHTLVFSEARHWEAILEDKPVDTMLF